MKIKVDYVVIIFYVLSSLLEKQSDIFIISRVGMILRILKYLSFTILLYRSIDKKKENSVKIENKYFKKFIPLFLLMIIVEIVSMITNPSFSFNYGASSVFSALMVIINIIITILSICCIYKIAGKNSIKYIVNAYIIDQIIVIIIGFINYGFDRAVKDLFSVVTFNTTGNSIFEVHGATYCIGLLILYYLYNNKDKISKSKMVLLFVLFLIGQKRIALGAFIIVILAGKFIKNIKFNNRTIYLMFLLFISLFFAYILVLYDGSFVTFMQEKNISLSGRSVLYRYFIRLSSFSIFQKPFGLDAVGMIFANSSYTIFSENFVAGALHNDMLRIYLEFGFIGSFFWLFFTCCYFPKCINKLIGENATKLYFISLCFSFIIYMVSNSYFYSPFLLLIYSIPLVQYDYNNEQHIYGNKMI